jgi:ABC-2 type transport system permease protein
VNQGNFKRFFPFLIAILIVKVLNLLIRWHVQYYGEVHVLSIDSLIRFLVNLVFLYLLFSNAAIYLSIIAAALLFGLYVYYKQQTKDKGLKWEFLIEQDESRLTSFYRLANLFTDVPKLKNQVKRRKWLDSLLVRISFQQDNAFTYLFTRTFLRSGDYWGLFVRLSVIGAGAIYFLTFGIGQVIMAVVFIYLTGFQLLPLWKHHQYHSMLELYPLSESRKEFSFLSFLRKVLFSQSILFALVLFVKGEFAVASITLLVCIVFSLYFVSIYTKRKIKG